MNDGERPFRSQKEGAGGDVGYRERRLCFVRS